MTSLNTSLSPNSQLILGTTVVATPLLLFALRKLACRPPTAEIEMAKKTVVVLGGGWNGSLAARQLSSQLDPRKYELILVNDRPYVINNIASARMTATGGRRVTAGARGAAILVWEMHAGMTMLDVRGH